MMRKWLGNPHINGWWGDPETEIALIEEDLENGPTDMRIVELEQTPFAFVQDYPAHHWPAPHYDGFDPAARAMDTFLGDPSYLGQGHASGYIRQRAQILLDHGVPEILIDPDPKNTRAVATYKRAGFVPMAERTCPDGDPVLVMRLSRQ
jgi:aminoglycoside 6'-N-acetyltransferase